MKKGRAKGIGVRAKVAALLEALHRKWHEKDGKKKVQARYSLEDVWDSERIRIQNPAACRPLVMGIEKGSGETSKSQFAKAWREKNNDGTSIYLEGRKA